MKSGTTIICPNCAIFKTLMTFGFKVPNLIEEIEGILTMTYVCPKCGYTITKYYEETKG